MRQIFERIDRIIRSNINSSGSVGHDEFLRNEDEELRKIIDELKNKEKENNTQNKTNNRQRNMHLNYACEVLEISSNANYEEIKAAYKKKILEYHPDKTEKLGKDLRDLALHKTKEINEAFAFMKKYHNK